MERNIAQLKELIRDEQRAVSQLVELLGHEREALSSRDLPAIDQVTRKKTVVLDSVERASAARADWARTAGVEPEGKAFVDFIMDAAVQAKDAELAEAWEKLRESLRSAHRENLVNGRIISRSRQTLSHLLDILRGQVDAPRLYGRSGQAGSSGDGGEIARA